jgi:hypothetical protein
MTEQATSIKLAYGENIRQSQLNSSQDYGWITMKGIVKRTMDPPSVPKSDGAWFLPSSYNAYDARQHEVQGLHGKFHMLVLDIDRNDLALESVRAIVTRVIGLAAYIIYATRSATPTNRKWRVLVPVSAPISGQDYEQTAAEFMLRMEDAGNGQLVLDRAATRLGQVFYLPNRGEYYEYEIAGEFAYHPPEFGPKEQTAVAVPRMATQIRPAERKQKSATGASPIKHFNDTHNLINLMLQYGYLRDALSDNFRSPLQTTQTFATRVYPESNRWVSLSGSDANAGLGRPSNSSISGDAFDLYVHYEHDGNFHKAVAAWSDDAGITQSKPKAAHADLVASTTRVELPVPASLEKSGLDYLQGVLDEHRGDAAHVFAVALRLSLRVPHQWALEEVRSFISVYAEPAIISLIMYRIDQVVGQRKWAAMTPSKLGVARILTYQDGQSTEHECDRVDRLGAIHDELLEMGGVFAIRAPMGAGKTQEIGRPLADWAKRNNRSFMAIAHRVSLVAEMARRLSLSDYRDQPKIDAKRLAICLPSILKEYAQTKPEVVFIDEILQTLQFLVSEECCRTKEGGPEVVFKALCKLITEAHVVVVADASLNDLCIEILAYCRRGESIKIIEMLPSASGKVADIYCGSSTKVRGAVGDLVLKELQEGGRVWLAVESPKLAKTLLDYYTARGFSTLCVHSEVKEQKKVAALLANADFNSRQYDIVIASPVISSGVSIEHRDRAHFTLGAYIGGGWVTTPADAMQQIGRVRYLRRFILGIETNNIATGGQVWFDEIKGRVSAAKLEQSSTTLGPFDRLVAHFKATHENTRSDFGAGLYWHLEAAGWVVSRKEIVEVDEAVSMITKELREAYECALMAAGHIDEVTADFLRRMPLTEEIAVRLEAYAIQQAFAVDVVTEQELLLWADGRFARQVERFEDAFGVGSIEQEQGSQIVHRSMRTARRLAYGQFFGGIDIKSEDWGTPDVMEAIVDRMMIDPQLYVSMGMLPKKYAARHQRRDGSYKPIKRPKNVGKVIEEMLTLLGLKANKTRTRIDGHQVRVIGTDMELFALVLKIAERRAARIAALTFELSEDDYPNL